MKEIIRVESKRILSRKSYLIISIIILIFSIFNSLSSLRKYNVYDPSGNIIIYSKDNLKESKLDKHNKLLDEKTIKEVVERKDKSKYLYNSNLVTLIALNYEKKVEDLTDKDISNFYSQRVSNFKSMKIKAAREEDKETFANIGKKLNTPIQLGYTEGWKNLNNDMTDFVTVVIFIIPFIILSIFGEDPKTRMKEIYTATKHGKCDLVKARIITGFRVGAIIYTTAIFIFSLSKLLILGFKGANLPIQSSVNYFFCPYNITYFEQYLINVVVGFMAMLVLVAITLLVSSVSEQILSSAVVVTFILGIMTMLPNNKFYFNHYFKNFVPYSMTNFKHYYLYPEIYNVFGKIIPTYTLVTLVSFIACIVFIILTVVISNKKLSSTLK
ncbi:hypothetical protein CHL78_014380 [Romboutsia weinsteinii]|uniref:Uncharacterized protein n=1 Tax=Romboutsia weinsteinii TaxID=2020949 RepID=A0A371J0I5_9FIRM|nr:hypothetical protein [Romboutsia weinsteinii]RDY26279.1 hypothetical protein CHL78_014380 [Romboutsia weinsteinii]